MKMRKIMTLVLAVAMIVTCFAACGGNNATTPNKPAAGTSAADVDLKGTYKITMWVSEKEGVADQFKEQIKAFEAANPGVKIEASIEGVSEANSATQVLADVATAPDIYCFAQDQLARLVQAKALAKPGKGAAETIKANNDAGSVAAATVAGEIYAYPMTSDNGFYMYYDKSIITEEEAESLEKLIAACEKNNKVFRYALEDAWIMSSFFFATGCKSTWTMNETGAYTSVEDTFNSAEGLIAMKGMQKLAQSPCYNGDANVFTDAAVVVTGVWNATAAADHFGENLAATDLPSFEVDGKSYHLGSFTGNKLIGVKPQTDAKRAAVLSKLAQYLTGKECQTQRFESFEWGPSNKEAQASEKVQQNISLAALAKQGEYGIPQGQIHGSWWDIAKVLGAEAKAAKTEDDLKTALTEYKAAVDGLFQMTDEQKKAWSVIGTIKGTNWDTDFAMIEDPAGTFTSEVFELKAGETFKVRQGASWDVNFGADGFNGANFVVEADGSYKVQLVWDGAQTGTITLIPA